MANIQRFSSRRERLDKVFLTERLRGAKSYKRIAGYFRSSIFELISEEISDIPLIRIVCNSELDSAALVECPLYRGGEQLQLWQRAFVAKFLDHREIYGQARLLLADEVGLGKTLSLAASAMVAALLEDGPVLILCPSTLTQQWQTELYDQLGIPSAVWLSSKKMWLDPQGRMIKTRGAADVACSPYRLAIVSTGLISHKCAESEALLGRRYGTVILDEAHKARRGSGLGEKKGERNNLLQFMLKIGPKTRHLLLGTATPIQTEVSELWDLLEILDSGVGFVLGCFNQWANCEEALPYIKGEQTPSSAKEAWEWIRSPLPPRQDSHLFANIRSWLEIPDNCFLNNNSYKNLAYIIQEQIRETLDNRFFKEHNPVIRHTVLRRRDTLENMGLLERISVNIHPKKGFETEYIGQPFVGLGLQTNHAFNLAYEAAENFTKALQKRCKAAGFMKTLLLQRICSSFASGKSTATKMLQKEIQEDGEGLEEFKEVLSTLTPIEASHLQCIEDELSRPEATDPKLEAIRFFLTEHYSEGKTWLEHGCIIFSQYYDTAHWIASQLAELFVNQTVAVYAGLGKSGLFKGSAFNSVEREEIKKAVKTRAIKLVVATDAACEGLNLQTLGALINVDLPWNPSRLEQRLGRIKRFGQTRKSVDMLNLVYHETQDEKIYEVLSRRLKDKFDLFGGLPDTIDDDWIGEQQMMEEKMNHYMHLREQAKNAFEIKAQSSIDPDQNRWELCSQVLSRKDIFEKLSKSW